LLEQAMQRWSATPGGPKAARAQKSAPGYSAPDTKPWKPQGGGSTAS
jgi:hypothetical protein